MALLGRDTSVTGPFPKGVLLLETLQGNEALGRPYRFELGLLSKEPKLEPEDVLGKPLAVGITLKSGGERFFHGIVTSFHKTGTTHLHTRYAAELRPQLTLFDFTFDCRVFNDPSQNALSIVTAVLAKRGLTDIESGADQRFSLAVVRRKGRPVGRTRSPARRLQPRRESEPWTPVDPGCVFSAGRAQDGGAGGLGCLCGRREGHPAGEEHRPCPG